MSTVLGQLPVQQPFIVLGAFEMGEKQKRSWTAHLQSSHALPRFLRREPDFQRSGSGADEVDRAGLGLPARRWRHASRWRRPISAPLISRVILWPEKVVDHILDLHKRVLTATAAHDIDVAICAKRWPYDLFTAPEAPRNAGYFPIYVGVRQGGNKVGGTERKPGGMGVGRWPPALQSLSSLQGAALMPVGFHGAGTAAMWGESTRWGLKGQRAQATGPASHGPGSARRATSAR